jgi:hypothetical protein
MRYDIVKISQNSRRKVSNGKVKLASFFESVKESITHINHQTTVHAKGLSLTFISLSIANYVYLIYFYKQKEGKVIMLWYIVF